MSYPHVVELSHFVSLVTSVNFSINKLDSEIKKWVPYCVCQNVWNLETWYLMDGTSFHGQWMKLKFPSLSLNNYIAQPMDS